MNVLYFTKYTRKGASSRLRSYQYFPYLEEAGISVTVLPLFSDKYLEQLYEGKVSKTIIIFCYFKRLWDLFKISTHTKVVIEKELFPYLPAWAERILSEVGIKYIVDYDDAIFHNYDKNPNGLVRFFLKHKIDAVMRCSSCVIVGNSYLLQRARKAGAEHIEIIPTVIDFARYQRKEHRNDEPFVIGWIGSPSTFKYLISIAPALEKMALLGAHIHIIGAQGDLGFTKNVFFIDWTELTETKNIAKFSVGIMPLQNTAWEKGKCSYKLIQYMASGLPVVASPVGMNREVVKPNENGYFAKTQKDWLEALQFYNAHRDICRIHGLNGLQQVKDKYTIEAQLETILRIIINN